MPYQVMNLPNAYGISNPQQWIILKRPDYMLAPPFTLPGWPRFGLGVHRQNVTTMPLFAPGGSLGRAFLPEVALRG